MTERERLIKLIEQCSCHYSPPCTGECCECHNVEMYDRNIEHIADHLLANGVIVPPCKVGDTVYVCFSRTRVIECKVARIIIEHIEEIGMSFICYGGMHFDMRHWGKTVFLTREEAEKALEGET